MTTKPNKRGKITNIETGGGSFVQGSVTIDEGSFIGRDAYYGFTADEVNALIAAVRRDDQPQVWDGRRPYIGLRAFREQEAKFFFGREDLVNDLLVRTERARFICVAGPSGSGKSSLVRAGLIYALKAGRLEHSNHWLYAEMTPQHNPIEQLALAMARVAKRPDVADYLRTRGQENVEALHHQAEALLSDDKQQRFVLLVDQFEEIFTQSKDDLLRAAFVEQLTRVATIADGRVIVIITLRSDFVSSCAAYPELRALMSEEFALIGALTPRELARSITMPALEVGATIEPELASRIIADMKGEPGALPLMQFALKDIFDATAFQPGKSVELTLGDYIQRGGIDSALERHADQVFESLTATQQEIARTIFNRVIEIGAGREDTRRIAYLNELVPNDQNADAVLAVLAVLAEEDARLLTTAGSVEYDATTSPLTARTVTIAHERLIDAWPWLRRLVDENRETIAAQNQIATDARRWRDNQRDGSYLYTGARLASTEERMEADTLRLGELSREFIDTGIARRITAEEAIEAARQRELERERALARANDEARKEAEASAAASAQSARRLRWLAVAIGLALVIAIVGAFGVNTFRKQANQKAREAEASSLAAQAQLLFQEDNRLPESIALAMESYQMHPSAEAEEVLRQGLALLPEPVLQNQHEGAVVWSAFSPDERLFATAGADGIIQVTELETGTEVTRIEHDGQVQAIAFSPDGRWLASASDSSEIKLWDIDAGRAATPLVHQGGVFRLAFSPNSQLLASAGDRDGGGDARVWDIANGREILRIDHGRQQQVNSVRFSPAGDFVLTAGNDGTAQVWDIAAKQPVRIVKHDDGSPIFMAVFSPDGATFATAGDDGNACVWKVAVEADPICFPHDSSLEAIAFHPDGAELATAGTDNTVQIWRLADGKRRVRLLHEADVYAVAYSPDGAYLASASVDGTGRVWGVASGREAARMVHGDIVWTVVFSPQGSYVATSSEDGTGQVWRTPAAPVQTIQQDTQIWDAAFSPDGRLVATTSNDHFTASLWDVETGEEVGRMPDHGAHVRAAAFSPDGALLATGSDDYITQIWTVDEQENMNQLPQIGQVTALAFHPDGLHIASGMRGGGTRMNNVQTGADVAFKLAPDKVTSLAYDETGERLFIAGEDGKAYLYDQEGNLLRTFDHGAAINDIALNPDGLRLATAGADGRVRLWETETGEGMGAPLVHGDAARAVSFDTTGAWLITGSDDETARLWDPETSEERGRIPYAGPVTVVETSGDGKQLLLVSDKTTEIWDMEGWSLDVDSDRLIDALCARLVGSRLKNQTGDPLEALTVAELCINVDE